MHASIDSLRTSARLSPASRGGAKLPEARQNDALEFAAQIVSFCSTYLHAPVPQQETPTRHSGHCIQTNRPTRWSTRIVGAAALLALTLLGQISTLAQTKSDGKTDQNGDPLPAGALARMGTLRWRHADTVNYIAFTPDGKAVLTAGQDNVVKVWDRATGKEIRRFAIKQAIAAPQPGGMIPFGVAGPGSRVALSEDGKIVAAGLPANTIQLWDVGTGKEIRQIKGPQFGVNALIFSPDGKLIAARSGDRATYILEADTGKEILQIKPPQPKGKNGVIINFGGGFGGNAGGMAFARDSKSIVTAEVAFNMQKMTTHLLFTDLATGKEIRKLEITGRGFDPIAYSPKGKLLAYAVGNDVHLLEADTAKELHKVTVPSPCDGIVFAPDGKTLAAKGADQIIRLIDTDTGKIGHSLGSAAPPLKGNGNVVIFRGFGGTEARDFAFSQDGKTLAAGAGPTVRFFTVATGQEQALTGGHRGAVAAVVLSADGKTLVSRGVDGSIRRWDAKTGKELGQIATPPGTIDAAFAPDGKTVAIATANGGVQLLGTSDGAKLHQFKSHQNGVAALAFAADGKTFASRGALNRTIRIHDAVKGTELKEILLPGDPNPNGQIFAFGGGLAGTSGQGLAFSPDGKTIAANVNIQQFNQANNQLANSSMLLLWDVTSGKQIRKIMLPPGRVPSVLAYSPDGRLLAYENNDSTISICEIVSGKERAHLGKPAPAGQPNQMFMGGGVFVIGGGPVRAARAHPRSRLFPRRHFADLTRPRQHGPCLGSLSCKGDCRLQRARRRGALARDRRGRQIDRFGQRLPPCSSGI